MNIYQQKTRWKYLLILSGVILLLISTLYTNFLATKLEKEEQQKVELWVIANKDFSSADSACNLTLHQRVMSSNFHIPALIVDEQEGIVAVQNFSCTDPKDPTLIRELEKIKANGNPPIPIVTEYFTQYVYYKESKLLQMLSFFPLVQIILSSAFIFIGYWLFSSARKSEQDLVWVGMAKETAHQLGTPISAINGWLDLLADDLEPAEQKDIMLELSTDVSKLETIADRFSKIGSKPVLTKQDLLPVVKKTVSYFEKRKPEKVQIEIFSKAQSINATFNEHLLTWVLENLMRNSLDAMAGKGTIKIHVERLDKFALIEFCDSGHGLSGSHFKTVFQPGYSTKKRGWGLGLSLAKRIVENYHKGKIFIKHSKPNLETCFVVEIPA